MVVEFGVRIGTTCCFDAIFEVRIEKLSLSSIRVWPPSLAAAGRWLGSGHVWLGSGRGRLCMVVLNVEYWFMLANKLSRTHN